MIVLLNAKVDIEGHSATSSNCNNRYPSIVARFRKMLRKAFNCNLNCAHEVPQMDSE